MCFHYRPNKCFILREENIFRMPANGHHRFDQNKQMVMLSQAPLHWQMFMELFYICFSFTLSLCRPFRLLHNPIPSTMNVSKTSWPPLTHTVLFPTNCQIPREKSFLHASHSTGKKRDPSLKRKGKQATQAKIDQSSSVRFRRGVPTNTTAFLTSNMLPGFMLCSSFAHMTHRGLHWQFRI